PALMGPVVYNIQLFAFAVFLQGEQTLALGEFLGKISKQLGSHFSVASLRLANPSDGNEIALAACTTAGVADGYWSSRLPIESLAVAAIPDDADLRAGCSMRLPSLSSSMTSSA